MRQFALTLCIALLSLAAAEQAVAKDDVAGDWKISALKIDGNPFPEDLPKLRIVLKDGKMEAYENGKLDEKGWYEIKPGNILVGYTDENENGKLDEDEKADGEEIKYARNGNKLVFTMEMDFGNGKKTTMEMTFVPNS